jgi:hypothetical protein
MLAPCAGASELDSGVRRAGSTMRLRARLTRETQQSHLPHWRSFKATGIDPARRLIPRESSSTSSSTIGRHLVHPPLSSSTRRSLRPSRQWPAYQSPVPRAVLPQKPARTSQSLSIAQPPSTSVSSGTIRNIVAHDAVRVARFILPRSWVFG